MTLENLSMGAIHEAGHAVAAMRLRMPIDRVTLDRKGGGRAVFSPRFFSIRTILKDTEGTGRFATASEIEQMKAAKERAFAQKGLISLFAGMAAERAFNPGTDEKAIQECGAGDLAEARRIARKFFRVSKEDMPLFLEKFDQKARKMLEDISLKIVLLDIARELDKRGQITARDCRKAYEYFRQVNALRSIARAEAAD